MRKRYNNNVPLPLLVTVAVMVLAAGFSFAYSISQEENLEYIPTVTRPANTVYFVPDEETRLCALVVTKAQDPATKKVKAFPSPCDVPDGWKVVR